MDFQQQQIEKIQKMETIKRELERRSQDILKVYNFLNEPFTIVYDGYKHTVEPKKEAEFPRYLAERFVKKIVTHQINGEIKEALAEEDAKRQGKGFDIMTPQEQDQYVVRHGLKTDNPERIEKYTALSYKGLVKEYGKETVSSEKKVKEDRARTTESIMEQIEKAGGQMEEIAEPEEKPQKEVKNEPEISTVDSSEYSQE